MRGSAPDWVPPAGPSPPTTSRATPGRHRPDPQSVLAPLLVSCSRERQVSMRRLCTRDSGGCRAHRRTKTSIKRACSPSIRRSSDHFSATSCATRLPSVTSSPRQAVPSNIASKTHLDPQPLRRLVTPQPVRPQLDPHVPQQLRRLYFLLHPGSPSCGGPQRCPQGFERGVRR